MPFPKLKGTVSRAFTIWFHYVSLFCSKVEMYCKQIFVTKKTAESCRFTMRLLFGFYVCSTQLALFRHSKARFSVPLLLGFTMLCRFAVKLKCTVNKFLPQKNGRVLPFCNAFVIRVLRLQHATCRFRGLLPHRT